MKLVQKALTCSRHAAAHLHKPILACVLLSAFAGTSSAQLAFSFQAPDDIPATTGTGHTILTMDCLAANGYGQWTASSSSTNSAGNPAVFLLSNKLTTSTADDAQAGVLAAKQSNSSGDAYPNEAMKCAANLNGNVRYVWMDNSSSRTKFYVEGFDPATTTNASTGIGIDFGGLPSSSSQTIVKDGSMKLYGEVTLPGSATLVTATNEPLYPDMFDIAIDASYLYIIWEQYSAGTYTVKAAAVTLNGTFTVTQLGVVGTGRRPTVAVDVRHSGSIAHIDACYLTALTGGQVEWSQYNGSTWNAAVSAPALVTSQAWSWINPSHARILDASTPGSGTTDKAIYLIAQDNTGKVSLYFARITSGAMATSADYCDGQQNTDRADPGSPYVCPVESSTGYDVIDDYIRAFINPYDGSNTSGAFNHFNCLYVLNRTSGLAKGKFPLMIIQGSDPDSGFCVSGGSTLGSFSFDDPVLATTNWPYEYVGTCNQMGIHVHWIGLNTGDHFYRRDPHIIDQDIEENTLLTHTCEVDGNVTFKKAWLTLYSDPASGSHNGYLGGGSLTIDNSTVLDVNPSGGGGDFVVVGPEAIDFTTTGSIIAIEQDNQMDFYGGDHSSVNGVGEFRLTGNGIGTSTSSYGTYVANITDPATLNIHGGSLLDVGITSSGANYFTCSGAMIHLNHETNVWNGSGTTASGELELNDHSSFTECEIVSDDNNAGDNPNAIQIAANGFAAGPTGNADYNVSYSSATYATDTFAECAFTCGTGSGHATMGIGDPNVAPNSLLVDNGLVDGWSFSGGNFIYWPIYFTNVTFQRIVQFGMDINLSTTPPTADSKLYSILVNDCGFQKYDDLTNFPNPDGIKIENAPDASLDDHLREAITVTSNTFESAGTESAGSVEAAIHFHAATGDIGYNTVSGSKYQRGVWNESSVGGADETTWSLICGNNISGLTNTSAAGLSTDYYTGYAKLNTITDNYYGHLSGAYDYDHDVATSLTGNSSYGYYGDDAHSITDMAGVHHPSDPSIDVASYNVIKTNNSSGTQIYLDCGAQIFVGLEPGSPTWPTTAYGLNDIEGSTDICSACTYALGDISHNYWGSGSYTLCSGTTGTGTYLTTAPGSSGFVCSDGLIIHKKGAIPQGGNTLPDTTCGQLYGLGFGLESEGSEPAAYDTLRLFLEQCPFYGDSVENGPDNSWHAFNVINGAVAMWSAGGMGRWQGYMDFLKKVLYLNPDTNWYCSDVGDMLSAEHDIGGPPAQYSISLYIVKSGKCAPFAKDFDTSMYDPIHQIWLDSIVLHWERDSVDGKYQWWVDSMVNKDTLAHPYDPTIPSIQDLGLSVLMGPQFGGVEPPSGAITEPALISAQLLNNPVSDEIGVKFQMGREALITMQLQDVLGRNIPIQYGKYQLTQAGSRTAYIPDPNLPPGTYYLRISTDVGDVITLKLLKQ